MIELATATGFVVIGRSANGKKGAAFALLPVKREI
jgi:hypothetical protein